MTLSSCAAYFSPIAPATFGVACTQGTASNFFGLPAITAAEPVWLSGSNLGKLHHHQSPVSSACYILSTQRTGKWSSVSHLLRSCSPATVLLCVRAIVIDTIQCTSLGALSHVQQKLSIAVPPRSAHVDTPSAVVAVDRIVRVIAAILGLTPRAVRWANLPAAGASVEIVHV